MDIARRNEIAYKSWLLQIKRKGMRVGQDARRDIGNTAKELGISFEEALEFAEILARDAVNQMFPEKSADAKSQLSPEDKERLKAMGSNQVSADLRSKHKGLTK